MKESTKKRIEDYLTSLHRDIFDWFGIMFRIFIISITAYLMIFFIENFGEFIQWKSGYDNPLNMTPIAWVISIIYWILKVITAVTYRRSDC